MSYDADVLPRGWNQGVSDFGGFERPVPEARYALIDFFRTDYDWRSPLDRHGQPGTDYLRNRIARLVFDLKTGEAMIDKRVVAQRPGQLASRVDDAMAVGGEGFEDFIGRLGPHEWLRVLVPLVDPLADVGFQLDDAAVR
jgi:hypothetical protein